MTVRPQVSVVIPTRDSVAHIDRCLASLTANQGASVEVLVVDQASTDGTRDVAVDRGATLINAPRPKVYGETTGHSRNLGAAVARGEYLLHLDADMTVAPGVLVTSVGLCRDAGHVALTLEEVDITDGFWAECKALERRTYRGSPILEAARFVRADVFHDVGGYDEGLGSAEDWDIHKRYVTRGSIGRVPDAIYHYLLGLSLGTQIQKKFRFGRSASHFLRKHEMTAFSHAMATAYRRSWRAFARDPLHAAGFAVLRLGEVTALAAGVALASVERKLPSS